jgi:hypothetical protein
MTPLLLAWLAACAVVRPLASDEAFSVVARARGARSTLEVALAEGWHLNPEYPSGFEADGGGTTTLVLHGEREGRVVVPTGQPGTLHLGFCEAERCRIEHLRYP